MLLRKKGWEVGGGCFGRPMPAQWAMDKSLGLHGVHWLGSSESPEVTGVLSQSSANHQSSANRQSLTVMDGQWIRTAGWHVANRGPTRALHTWRTLTWGRIERNINAPTTSCGDRDLSRSRSH